MALFIDLLKRGYLGVKFLEKRAIFGKRMPVVRIRRRVQAR